MSYLVTGGAGFVGSHILEYLIEKGHQVYSIDSYKHKGCPLRRVEGVDYIVCDLSHPIGRRLTEKLKRLGIKYIINAASLSHVDTSIDDPVPFVQNNVNIALHMLELARELRPNIFFQVSTDEVYGAAPGNYHHKEWDVIVPSNPYAGSKAAQEAIAISYWRTFGVPLVITNTMNMIGERQDPEKYLPMIFSRAKSRELIKVHGSPESIGSRYYLYAKDFADAIYHIQKLADRGDIKPKYDPVRGCDQKPPRLNIVGETEYNNLELVQMVEETMGKPANWKFEDFHKTRPGHDRRYALDSVIMRSLGWVPKTPIKDAIKQIHEFNQKHPEWLL